MPHKHTRLVVGLTGTFGSGKSTVAKIWKSKGVRIIDCDKLVHEVYWPKHHLAARIKRILNLKSIDRREIAEIIFQNPAKRKALERLIHPYVKQRVFQELRRVKSEIAAIEMPLLFEIGFDREVDYAAVVSAKSGAIRKRLLKKGFSQAEVNARQKAQWPIKRKIKHADFIIDNSGSLSELKKKAERVFRQLSLKITLIKLIEALKKA